MVDRIQKDNSDVIPNRCISVFELDDQVGEESLKREYGCNFLSGYCEAIGILLLGRSDQAQVPPRGGQDFVQDDKHKYV